MLRSRGELPTFRQQNATVSDFEAAYKETDVERQDVQSVEFTFRSLQPSDREIIQQLHEEWFPVRYEPEFYQELCDKHTFLGDPVVSWVALDPRGNICGCLVGQMISHTKISQRLQKTMIQSNKQHSKLFYIMTLGVRDDYRQRGLGTRLMDECCQRVVEPDPQCGAIFLHVITYNQPAIRFYERLEFRRIDELPDYYQIEKIHYNCYLYARFFHGNYNSLWYHTLEIWKTIRGVLWQMLWWCPYRRNAPHATISSSYE